MYKIGEFSKMCMVTIKALRHYEKEKLLIPAYIDRNTNYRYYNSSQLLEISKIIALKQIGLSLKDIRMIIKNKRDMKEILLAKKQELQNDIILCNDRISKINYLLEKREMENDIFIKEIPAYNVYYREGIIKNYDEVEKFVLSTAEECKKLNPNITCPEPGYCFVNYLDHGYKEENIKLRYVEAVNEIGKGNEIVKFMKLEPITAVCIYHRGSYDNISETYHKIVSYIENSNYERIDEIREVYIDGCWNKEDVKDYLTELQVPVKKS